MPTWIKAGYWLTKDKAPKSWLNLETLISANAGGGGGGTTLVPSIKSTFANLPESEIGQIHFITDLGFGGGKGNPVVTGGGTTGAAIWDGTDWLQL